MSDKPLRLHPEALAEADSALIWYRERSARAYARLEVSLVFVKLPKSSELVFEARQFPGDRRPRRGESILPSPPPVFC